MSRRTSGMLASLVLVVSGLAVLGTSVAQSAAALAPDDVITYCSADPTPPCIVSFKHDGVAVDHALYRIQWNEPSPASGFYSWYFSKFIGSSWSSDMGTDETTHSFAVTFDFGTFDPATAAGLANPSGPTPVTWGGSSTYHLITMTTSPVHWLAGCTDGDPPSCPMMATADNETFGALTGVVNNASWFQSTGSIAHSYNLSNITIARDPYISTDAVTGARSMIFTLLSPHESATSVVFTGFQHLRLPNGMLHDVYGIPAPQTMTAASLGATLSGGTSGTITVRPEAGHAAMLIDITGVTFSTRNLKVRLGTITPSRPSGVKGKRLSPTRGRVTFTKSAARGAYPTGYQLRCVSGHQVRTATGSSTTTRFRLHGLTPGRHYTCRVRAKSHVGSGPWSFAAHL